MEWLVATYEFAAVVVMLMLGAGLLAYRVVHGIGVYYGFRGTRQVI
jgi:hypothetical protein